MVAGVLMVAIAGYCVPAGAIAATQPARSAEIRGNVLSADGLTGIAGVSVKAAHLETRQIFTSGNTLKDGTYTLAALPPGTYDLAVETPQGLYVADILVDAEPGRSSVVSLALRPAAPGQSDVQSDPNAEQGQEGQKEGEKKADDAKEKEGQPPAQPPEPPAEKKKKKKGGGFWRSPGGAAIGIVGGAVLIGIGANSSTNDDNEPPMTQSGSGGGGGLL
jgi:hypothetical protein